jgi:mannosyl-3-phosphoglycerate phosphatase
MKLIIFTDLDGTLLEYYTYSFKTAQPALDLIKEKNIPLIICSSKTKKEIKYYRKKLENNHPFISENGGGIFIPKGYFKFQISDFGFTTEEVQNYLFIRLGARYDDLRKAIIALKGEGFRVKGFGDMTIEEIAKATKLSVYEAAMAKERDFDEPFLFKGNDEEKTKLMDAIRSKGFNFTESMFYHILGHSDKGKAVSILIGLYRKKIGEIITVAIGDSPNDITMLEKVDRPIVVQGPDGSYETEINIPRLIKADGIGPEGWNSAVLKFLK